MAAGGFDVTFHVRHFRAQQAVTSATASRLNSGVYRLLEIGKLGSKHEIPGGYVRKRGSSKSSLAEGVTVQKLEIIRVLAKIRELRRMARCHDC